MPVELKFPPSNWMAVPPAALNTPPKAPPPSNFSDPADAVSVPVLLNGTPILVMPVVPDLVTVPAF